MNEWLLLIGFIILVGLALSFAFYPLRKSRLSWFFIPLVVLVFTSFGYWQWGAWPSLQHYHQQQAQQKQAKALLKSMNGPEGIIKALRAKLNNQPESAHGWYLLGRLYVSQQQWQQANDAFKLAHHLEPDNDQTALNYAQSLWQVNHQQFTPKIRKLLKAVLQRNPNQPDAIAMLATDAYEQEDFQQAIDYWQHLLDLIPPQSDEAKAIRRAINKARARVGSKSSND